MLVFQFIWISGAFESNMCPALCSIKQIHLSIVSFTFEVVATIIPGGKKLKFLIFRNLRAIPRITEPVLDLLVFIEYFLFHSETKYVN